VGLWEADSGRLLATLPGHTGLVSGVALSADGRLMASGGMDGTVRLWDARGGVGLQTSRPDRHYERLDITGLTGITDAQRQALLALGAVEGVPDTSLAAPPGQQAAPVPEANRAGDQARTASLVEPLSPRELDVLKLLAAGRPNAELARDLVVVEGTVKSHLIHIYGKLGVHTRTQAVARARALRLLD
jgi:DNA-binding CsgD family transcriptional regulator